MISSLGAPSTQISAILLGEYVGVGSLGRDLKSKAASIPPRTNDTAIGWLDWRFPEVIGWLIKLDDRTLRHRCGLRIKKRFVLFFKQTDLP